MYKMIAPVAAALIALAPLAVSAQSTLTLDSTKSTGNKMTPVGEPMIMDDVVLVGPGLGTAGAIALGVGGLLLIGALLSDDDSTAATTTTP